MVLSIFLWCHLTSHTMSSSATVTRDVESGDSCFSLVFLFMNCAKRKEMILWSELIRLFNLLKVIDTFQLKISEDRLMSRCTKCNGSFIQKPLTLDEAMQASKGFQVIPSCLFNRNLEFWKCTDCNQLYWEVLSSVPFFRSGYTLLSPCFLYATILHFPQGTQYHNAVQKFMSVCNISEWALQHFFFKCVKGSMDSITSHWEKQLDHHLISEFPPHMMRQAFHFVGALSIRFVAINMLMLFCTCKHVLGTVFPIMPLCCFCLSQ
jgi:hypothetical protein